LSNEPASVADADFVSPTFTIEPAGNDTPLSETQATLVGWLITWIWPSAPISTSTAGFDPSPDSILRQGMPANGRFLYLYGD
jgi:hypothetical protein